MWWHTATSQLIDKLNLMKFFLSPVNLCVCVCVCVHKYIFTENGIGKPEFKSRTKLTVFHFLLLLLGNALIHLYSHYLWVNNRADFFFSVGKATSQGKVKLNWNQLYSA